MRKKKIQFNNRDPENYFNVSNKKIIKLFIIWLLLWEVDIKYVSINYNVIQ